MPDVFIAQNKNSNVNPAPIGLFTSFCTNPLKVSFQNQQVNEQILLFLRQHFITNFGWIVSFFLLILIPPMLLYLLLLVNFSLSFISTNTFLILLGFYYLLGVTYAFIKFLTWYFNITLVTTLRIVDMDFTNLVNKKVAETKLDLVQDVSYKQIGPLTSVFNFGTVLIQTAGTIDNFDLPFIPKPETVVNIIEDLIGKEEPA